MHVELEKRYRSDTIDADILWDMLKDAQRIARCIPYADGVYVEGNRLTAKVRPPYSFIKGRFSIECEITDVDDIKKQIRVKVKGSSIGSSFDAILTISSLHDMLITLISADTHGLLRTLPESLIQRVVEEVSEKFLSCIMEDISNR